MSPVWSLIRRRESSSFQSRDLHNSYQFTCMPLFPSDAAKISLSMKATMDLRTELYVFSRQQNDRCLLVPDSYKAVCLSAVSSGIINK